jgi:hypothetical protein
MEYRRIDLVPGYNSQGNCAGFRAVSGKRGFASYSFHRPCAVLGHKSKGHCRVSCICHPMTHPVVLPWTCRFRALRDVEALCLGVRQRWARLAIAAGGVPSRGFPAVFRGVERRYRSAMTGLLDVKGISAPEVKFLDRRRTNGGELETSISSLDIYHPLTNPILEFITILDVCTLVGEYRFWRCVRVN